jgi:hypothetical protein
MGRIPFRASLGLGDRAYRASSSVNVNVDVNVNGSGASAPDPHVAGD